MGSELLFLELIRILVAELGHEKAHQLVSEEEQRRANIMADAVAAARVVAQPEIGSTGSPQKSQMPGPD